jgi:PAS domain S-box-containing protein
MLPGIWTLLMTAFVGLPSLRAADPLPPIDPNLPTLTSVQQLRVLPREEARQGYPVHVRAVVTYFDLQWHTLFIEDTNSGCFVFASDQARVLRPGQLVEIEGRSGAGFVPVIHESKLTILGDSPLPNPRPVTLDRLISGAEDSQRVQIQTVVRSMMVEHSRLILEFDEAGGRFEAHVPNYQASALPLHLLGARVEMTGIAGANLNLADRPLGIRLYLTNLDAVRVVAPANTNAFAQATQPIDSLLWFNPATDSALTIKVAGVVTLASSSGKLFVQDSTGGTAIQLLPQQNRKDPNGLYLNSTITGPPKAGDRVEIVGYPAFGEFAPVLRDAWLRRTGSAPQPRAVSITSDEALSGRHDGRLVAIQARLLSHETRHNGTAVDQLLTLQSGSAVFDARIEDLADFSVAPNSLLEISGICTVQADERRQPRSFRLLPRGSGDLRVLEAPPGWNWQGSLQLLGIAVVVAALAIARLVVLRRRVQKQEERIGNLTRESEIRERYRTLFESLQDVYYRADLNGITTQVSPSCQHVLGFPAEELIGRPTTMTCVDPQERERLFESLIQHGAVNDYEMLLCRKGGQHLTVSLNAHALRDSSGRIVATEGFIRDITQRKKAENALRESEQLLASITHNISEAIYRSTPGEGLIYVNESFVRMFGYSSVEEVLKLPSRNLYADAEGRARLIELIERNGSFNSEEVEFLRKDGSRFWGLTSSIGIFDPQTHHPTYFDGAIIDITDRKRIEEERLQLNAELERRITNRTAELRQSEERFSKAFHASPAILSILRLPDGQYLDVNEAFLQTYGFRRDEVIGRTSLELNLWQDPSKRAELFAGLKAGEPVCNQEVHYRTKTGDPKVILHSTELIELGDQTCVLAVGQDITENKRVNAALAESEAHTRLIIDTALDAVITMDDAGSIKGWNPQAEAIFGWTSKEAIGRKLGETIIPLQFREAHQFGLARFLDTGEGPVLNRRIELTALHRSGREFPAELAITALSVGGSYIFSAFVRDITDRKRAEEELLKALDRERELGKLKSNFVSMVSHEFRTPLGIIMSSAEILERYLERLRPDQRVEHLQAIHKSVQRMAGMMEEVLVLGRVEAGKMECKPAPIDLVSFCQRLTDELHSATNRQCPIEFEASPLPEDAEADEGLLRHIFTNLLTNGVKYSRPGETVKFVLRYRDFQAVFTVEDKGVGIPEADQQWIFRAFHRGQNVGNLPGTGLGLTIVKRCVELHGGKIKCQSTEGVGTKFVVTLPLFGRPVNVGTETALFMNRP